MRKLPTAPPDPAADSNGRHRTASGLHSWSPELAKTLDETSLLLRNPKNAKRLLESIAELESGRGAYRPLIETTAD